ncbi:MAG: hypothetical protein WC732_00660 [Candidatus Omnitrophota bacterium]
MSRRVQEAPIVLWEEAAQLLEFFKGLFAVVTALIFRPSDFFNSFKSPGSLSIRQRIIRALVFALVLGYLKLTFDVVNIFWVRHLARAVSPDVQVHLSFASLAIVHSPLFLFRPLLSLGLTFLFVAAGVKLVLGFDKAILPVFLIVCYKGAADIFYAIPLAGGFFASVWAAVLLVTGVRQLYGVLTWRSLVSAVIMPFFLFFFLALSIGPVLNKAILRFYPELRAQVIRLNDMTAYMYTTAIINAAKTYRQELGFFPSHMEGLKKYMSKTLSEDVARPDNSTGYAYTYALVNPDHFVVWAVPVHQGLSGRFVFYADESGRVRLNDASGPVIKDAEDLEKQGKSQDKGSRGQD